MKLLKLKISNLFGLKENNEFNFEESNLIAIVGKNGSGKSSIMDATRLAFFGDPTSSREVTSKDYIRKGCNSGSVEIEFLDALGKTRRIKREFLANNRGVVQTAIDVSSLSENNEWITESTSISEATALIASYILYGRDVVSQNADAAAECVKQAKSIMDVSSFISQGMMTAILSLTPTERLGIISRALNLDGGDLLKQGAKELKSASALDLTAINTKVDGLQKELEHKPSTEEIEESIKNNEEALQTCALRDALFKQAIEIINHAIYADENAQKIQRAVDSQSKVLEQKREAFLYGDVKTKLRTVKQTAALFAVEYLEAKKKQAKGREIKTQRAQLAQEYNDLTKNKETLSNEISSLSEKLVVFPLIEQKEQTVKQLAEKKSKLSDLQKSSADFQKEADRCTMLSRTIGILAKIKEQRHLSSCIENEKQIISGMKENTTVDFMALLRLLSKDGKAIDISEITEKDTGVFISKFYQSNFKQLINDIAVHEHLFSEYSNKLEKISISSEDKAYLQAHEKELSPMFLDLEYSDLQKKSDEIAVSANNALKSAESARNMGNMIANDITALEDRLKSSLEKLSAFSPEKLTGFSECVYSDLEAKHNKAHEMLKMLEVKLGKIKENDSALQTEFTTVCLEVRQFVDSIPMRKNGIQEAGKLCRDALTDFTESTAIPISEAIKKAALSTTEENVTKGEIDKLVGQLTSLEEQIKTYLSDKDAEVKKYCILSESNSSLPECEPDLKQCANTLSLTIQRNETSIKEQERINSELAMELKQIKQIQEKLDNALQQQKKVIRAVTIVNQFAKKADGNNFSRYISDKAMENLLYGVNKELEENNIDWVVKSDAGKLYIKDEAGEVRPVSGISGGEATLISILLLKQLGNTDCLWIDEGLTMLDEKRLQGILDILGNKGAAQVVVVTHDSDLAREFPLVWTIDSGTKIEPEMEIQP